MGDIGITDPRELQIQGLIDRYLKLNDNSPEDAGSRHLDEDFLTAFIDGNLSEREEGPVTSHLVDCSFCRHVTAELVKLDLAFSDEADPVPTNLRPVKVADVLSGILGRILGSNEGAVFAHEEPADEGREEGVTEDEKGE